MHRPRVELADLPSMDAEIRRRSYAFNRRPGARNNRGRISEGGGVAAAPVTPLSIITSVPVVQWIRGDLGVTVGTGLAALGDQSGNGHHFAQGTGSAQPPYTAVDATLNNRPSFAGDGANDTLLNGTMPNGNGNWVSGIIKVVTWVTNRVTWGANAAPETGDLLTLGGTPNMALFNGASSSHINGGLPANTWGRVELYGVNTAAGYLKLRSTTVPGALTGAVTSVGCALFSTTGVAFGNHAIGERVVCSGKPTPAEIAALDAYYVGLYTQANVE